mmetsp:Transcript_15771/g.33706  ORF Transcript_15771/g.33706 Transcript_15771/m.33706 type:complete len:668 (-) Transcript_15771:148-2151(-)
MLLLVTSSLGRASCISLHPQAQAPDNDLNVNQDSHMGYRYAALPLAARGFFVVSALNVAAVSSWNQAYTLLNDDNDLGGEAGWARNGLAHLELLGRLNEGVQLGNVGEGEDLTGKLDMQNIGLMGHSRGGQSVRIMQEALRTGEGNVTGGPLPCANTALPIDQQVPLTFCEDKGPMTSAYPNIPAYHVAAVIEIAPVDFQTYFSPDNYITPVDTPWLVLIPMCDNDVNALSGRCPFDRAVQRASQTGSLPKSMMAIFQIDGTSHDTYNSHWQEQDYAVCHSANNVLQSVISGRNFEGPLGTHLGLDDPRLVASAVLANWFAAFVGQGADTKYSQLFDPAFALPYIVGLTAVTENHIKRELVHGSDMHPGGKLFAFNLLRPIQSSPGTLLFDGDSPFMRAQAPFGTPCVQRTLQLEWNSCIGKQKIAASGDEFDGTCGSARTPDLTITDDLVCAPGFVRSNRGYCTPSLVRGPSTQFDNLGEDPSVSFTFPDVDVSPFTYLTFSIAREYSELNPVDINYQGNLEPGTDFLLTAQLDDGDGPCVHLKSYLYGNAGVLDGPDANILTASMTYDSATYDGSPAVSFVNGTIIISTDFAQSFPLFDELGAPRVHPRASSENPLHLVYYPAMKAVRIPLEDLGISSHAKGLKLVLAGGGSVSGAILLGPLGFI